MCIVLRVGRRSRFNSTDRLTYHCQLAGSIDAFVGSEESCSRTFSSQFDRDKVPSGVSLAGTIEPREGEFVAIYAWKEERTEGGGWGGDTG